MGEANIWKPRKQTEISGNTKSVEELITATTSQLVFTLETFEYAMGTGALEVHKNGLLLTKGVDWTEQSSSSFVLTAFAAAGDSVVATGKIGIEGTAATYLVGTGYNLLGDFSDAALPAMQTGFDVLSSTAVVGREEYLWRCIEPLPYTPTGNDPTQAPELGKWAAVAIGELKTVALSRNVPVTDTIYDTDTVTAIPAYIFSATQEKTYLVPSDARGKFISALVGTQLTTTDLAVYTLRSVEVINSRDFGAYPSLTVDQAPALNAMFDHARLAGNRENIVPTTGQITALKIVIEPGIYRCNSGINVTMLQFQGWSIKADGATIWSHAAGVRAWDMLGSRFGDTSGLVIIGDVANVPKIGLQYGRLTLGISADNLSFSHCKTGGYFSLAGVYNFASETDEHDHPAYYNYSSDLNSFGMLIDGTNMFNCESSFVTQAIPVDTAQSCIQHLYNCADIRKPKGGPAIGIVRSDQVLFAASYAVTINDYAVRLYDDDNGMRDITLDIHTESGASGAKGVLDFRKATGAVSAASDYWNLHLNEHSLQVTNRVISIDAAITDLRLRGSITIAQILGSLGAPANGLVIPGNVMHFVGNISCPGTLLKGNFEHDGNCTVESIAAASFGVGNITVRDDSGTTIHKGNISFKGNRAQTSTGANLISGGDTTLRDSVVDMGALAVQPPIGGVNAVLAVDDGTNWSGVNATGSPRPVFFDGVAWQALV